MESAAVYGKPGIPAGKRKAGSGQVRKPEFKNKRDFYSMHNVLTRSVKYQNSWHQHMKRLWSIRRFGHCFGWDSIGNIRVDSGYQSPVVHGKAKLVGKS